MRVGSLVDPAMMAALSTPVRRGLGPALAICLLLCVATPLAAASDRDRVGPATIDAKILEANCRAAAGYSRRFGGETMLVSWQGRILCEDYNGRFGPGVPHRLASGTKSFWGVLALAAVEDGLFGLDDLVSATITEWREDPDKSRIRVRQLLDFTSGLDPATSALQGRPERSDKFATVLGVRSNAAPGRSFTYGPSHLFAFGLYLKRRLAAAGRDPDLLHYLRARILDPIGVEIGRWQTDAAGNPIMPAGAHVAPREWLAFGELVRNGGVWNGRRIIGSGLMRELSAGSQANPAYGLTFWLNHGTRQGVEAADGRDAARRQKSDEGFIYAAGPRDLLMAAGQGRQRLYIIPSLQLVVVRQGEGGEGWRDSEFLSILLAGAGSAAAESRQRPTASEALAWRSVCAKDIQTFCADAADGAGALRQCFALHRDQISQPCKDAVRALRAVRQRGDGGSDARGE